MKLLATITLLAEKALVILAWVFVGLFAFGLLGCAAPNRPWVSTRVVGEFRMGWFYDGPELVIEVGNPTDAPASLVVLCGGAGPWPVVVPARDRVTVLGRVNNSDAAFSPCRLEE